MKSPFLGIFIIILTFLSLSMSAQDSSLVVGYVFESNNKGYLSEVKIVAKNEIGATVLTTMSEKDGRFQLLLPRGQRYQLLASKNIFKDYQENIDLTVVDTQAKTPIFLKWAMDRLPGYLLEASITEFITHKDSTGGSAFSLDGVTIEIYNNTTFQEELRLVAHPHYNFSFLLEQGNEYIFMLRKEGYYTKRMRANVNVNGCILCLNGFGTVTPGVTESLTRNNTMGTMIANVTMQKFEVGKTVKMDNIYYDYGSAAIRRESYDQLNQLAEMMRDNPRIVIELASHTDCRGSKEVNKSLSQKRAEAVVGYIKNKASIKNDRIVAKGYGEENPVNSCVDGVDCTEELYQQNRRTEFMIIDVKPDAALKDRTLASIMRDKNERKILEANEDTYFKEGAATDTVSNTKKPIEPSAIPMLYNGFKIELMSASESPNLDHPIFVEFNPVYLDISADSRISFLVGDFNSKAAAEAARSKYLKKYPKAKVVEYKEGIRK